MNHRISFGITIILLALTLAVPTAAYSEPVTGASIVTRENWHWKKKNGEMYLLDSSGKRVRGLKKLNGKTYLLAKKNGRQLVGWQKRNGKYYYFRISPGSKGYMARAKTVNHIYLRKDGTANVTASNKKRLAVLFHSQKKVEKYTHTCYKKSHKLKQVWNRFQKEYRYHGNPKFHNGKQWEVEYASDVLKKKEGSCYDLGATFAFLANACGYSDACAVSSGGHGWAEVDKCVFDPAWDRVDRKNNYYHRSMKLSGKNHSPNYKRARKYVKRI